MTFTEKLIKELGEEQARDKTKLSLLFIVRILGQEKCLKILKEAKEAHSNGELIIDGSRQRTLGGCFFERVPNDVNALAKKEAKDLYKAMNQEAT